jgi:uncharacterized tellurite resistance protein B-like protein
MTFLKFLGLETKKSDVMEETETIREISRKLDRLEPAVASYHAFFACILSRVARVDLHISEEETRKMENILLTLGHLSQDMAVLVVEIAKRQNELLGGVENYLVTREFKKISDRSQREHLLECLLAVAAADETISSHENAEVRKITDELGIERKDFIAIRSRFREHLGVLKGD